MNRASKNVHYNRGICSVNSLFGFYLPNYKSIVRADMYLIDKTLEGLREETSAFSAETTQYTKKL